MSEKVQVEVHDHLMIITINRPEVRNAVDREVSYAVCEAVDQLDADPDLRVGILTGAGGTFCSGMDLGAFARGEVTRVKARGILGMAMTPPDKPMIAAVEGFALAGGFEAALACDLLVAAADARFGLPEAKRGLVAAAGGLFRLPRVIPQKIAMEIALTGDLVTAERLERYGLVNSLVDPGEALEASVALAQKIITNAPLSIAASKKVINGQRDWTTTESFSNQQSITQPVLDSDDAREGARAFKEKRNPTWSGR